MFRLTPAGSMEWRGRVGGIALSNPGFHKQHKQAISPLGMPASVSDRTARFYDSNAQQGNCGDNSNNNNNQAEWIHFKERYEKEREINSVPNVNGRISKRTSGNIFNRIEEFLCFLGGFLYPDLPIKRRWDWRTHSRVEPWSRVAARQQHRGRNPHMGKK